MERQELIDILRVGLKAVSPYNCQPWKFQYKDQTLLIFAKKYERGFFGNFQELIYYSLGAFLENLSEGARHYHYAMDFTVTPDNKEMNAPVCTVSFTKTPGSPQHDIAHIMGRYTNRKIYHRRPLDPSVLKKIRADFQGYEREVIDITNNPVIIDNFALLERIRVSNPELNDELIENIQFNPKNSPPSRTGLDIMSLEIPFMSRQFLRASKNPVFRKMVRNLDFVQYMAQTAGQKILNGCPLLIAFKEPHYSTATIVRDWMDIQRILNTLHQDGLCSQLLASGIDMLKMDRSFLKPFEMYLLSGAETKIQKNLGVSPASIMTLLRIGYADDCRVKSLRLDPEELLTAWEA